MLNSYEAWAWAKLLRDLDAVGLAIVKKPTIEKGAPSKPGGTNG